MKSQVPSVQYISLTTINRIFDIYVYHNLFYPGYYESCYIPLSKRKLNKQRQIQLEIERNLSLKTAENENKLVEADTKNSHTDEFSHLDKPKKKTYFFSHKQQSRSSRTNKKYCNCDYTKNELDNLNLNELNACVSGNFSNKFSYKLNFEMKDKNSTIKEDPSSADELSAIQQVNNLGNFVF